MGEGIRLFVGVPVAAAVAGELAGTCESLARRATAQKVAMRWLAPASYHITLRYLGWTRRETVPAVEEAIRKAVAGAAIGSLRFRCERLGAFASPARASVVWAGVEDTAPVSLRPTSPSLDGPVGALATLAAALEREIVPLGFQAEKRAFHPHVTIARLKEPTRVDQVLLPFAEQVFSETRCDSLTLFESLTKPSGSEYREVLRVPLSGTISAVQRQSEPVQTGPLDASPGSDDGWK